MSEFFSKTPLDAVVYCLWRQVIKFIQKKINYSKTKRIHQVWNFGVFLETSSTNPNIEPVGGFVSNTQFSPENYTRPRPPPSGRTTFATSRR